MPSNPIHILCLHGAGSNAAKLEKSMNTLIQKGRKSNIHFHFLESDFKNDRGPDLKQWWSFPKEGDIFNIPNYDTGIESLMKVCERWNRGTEEQKEFVPFDGLFGFSQGSAVSQLFLFECLKEKSRIHQLPKFFILCGTFSIFPEQFRYDPVKNGLISLCPVLGFNGDLDPLVSPERSEECLKSIIDPSQLTLKRHPGKHYVPSRSNSVEQLIEFILSLFKSEKSSEAEAQFVTSRE